MMTIQMIGKEIHARREAVGLSQTHLAKLANLSRQTVQRLEAGTIVDLSFQRLNRILSILGLNLETPSLTARQRKKGLWMAAKTSSVSYRREMSSEELESALSSGNAPEELQSNLLHFLDEAPLPVVVMAVEETAQQEKVNPTTIWTNVGKLGKQLGAIRHELWA
ncbi:MAG: transcriptional regulator [Burkholderia sp.]|jgi:transcriptional regulator with XRE-family HTH domain|nr:transcriptional regulator [Burkholderia sp.]